MTEDHSNPIPDARKALPIVYVREVARNELPEQLRGTPGAVFAVHDAAGNRLALAADRRLAFALAKRNDMIPLSVH